MIRRAIYCNYIYFVCLFIAIDKLNHRDIPKEELPSRNSYETLNLQLFSLYIGEHDPLMTVLYILSGYCIRAGVSKGSIEENSDKSRTIFMLICCGWQDIMVSSAS